MNKLIEQLNEITGYKVKEEIIFKLAHIILSKDTTPKSKELEKVTMTMGELFEFQDVLDVGEKDVSGLYIETPSGLSEIKTLIKKPKEEIVTVRTSSTESKVASKHIFPMINGEEVFAEDVTEVIVGQTVEKVLSKEYSEPEFLYDISIPYPHLYYTENKVLHHNSALLMSSACSVYMAKKNVLFISLEMTDMEIGRRIDANLLNYSANDLGEIDRREFEKRLTEISKLAGNLVIKDYSAGTFSVLTLKSLMGELKAHDGFVPDLICIDYIGLMGSTRTTLSSAGGYGFYKSIAEELHGFSKKEDIAILTAAQLNRCVGAGTIINGKRIEDIKTGENIQGSDGEVTVITKKSSGKLNGYKIITKSGKEIIVSRNHRFPTKDGLISIETGLSTGMKICTLSSV